MTVEIRRVARTGARFAVSVWQLTDRDSATHYCVVGFAIGGSNVTSSRHKKIARLCRIPCIRLHGWIPLRVLNWAGRTARSAPSDNMATRSFTVGQRKNRASRFRSRLVVRVILASCDRPFLSTTRSLIPHILCQKNVSQLPKLRRARIKASGRKTVRLIRHGSNLKRLAS